MADNLGVNPLVYNNEDFSAKARSLVHQYVVNEVQPSRHPTFAIDEVFVVWFAKTLRNWKALVSTTLPDGRYYEVTYDGDLGATYVDVYQKTDHFEILDHKDP